MPITYGDAGTNRSIAALTYGDAGTNRTISEVWIGDGGVNRLVYAAVGVVLLGLDPTNIAITPANASATYSLTNAGLETASGRANNTWLVSGAVGDYEARATVTSGALTSGTTGAWLNLGTTRSWNLTRTSDVVGTDTATMTIEVRVVATGVVIATESVTFTAEVTS